jgi:hypothetical protein
MARYRSRPAEIEAEQWFPGKTVRGVELEAMSPDAGRPGATPIAIRQALHRVFPVPADSTSLAYANKPVSFFTTPSGFRHQPTRPAFSFSFARFRRFPIHRPPAMPVFHSLVYRPPAMPVPPGGGRP